MMKKYLMTGMAAVALCAAFTSCSNHEFFDESRYHTVENYEKAFIKRFGEPAPNHTWGFGTRANTRAANPDGNMWEKEGWNVPPVITDAQKDIVRQYFQQNKDLGYTDPQWTDFWIQQVYKGGTNTDESQTAEKYTIGNGDSVTGGDNMDHLASKDANGTEDHINDFNNSDNNDWEGRMLMENSSTYSFGYNNSNGSVYHYDKAALVSWTVIRDWANARGLNGDVLNDGWNRSYMGFDWEQVIGDDVYAGKGWWHDGAWDNDTYPTFEFGEETYRCLNSNTNQYAYDENEPTYEGKLELTDIKDLTDELISELLKLGYLPVSNSDNKVWIKIATGADGYYSDWIVTLTEAKKQQEQEIQGDCRVIAEDLTINENGDFDFNDVVFDVKFGNPTKIILQAAGGTLPLYIAGREVHELFEVPVTTMVNTGAGATKEAVVFDVDVACQNREDVRDNIKVEVEKDGKRIELKAPIGRAPGKVCVDVDYDWCTERQDIEEKYSTFKTWVTNPTDSNAKWWRK